MKYTLKINKPLHVLNTYAAKPDPSCTLLEKKWSKMSKAYFSSATKGYNSNVNILLASLAIW